MIDLSSTRALIEEAREKAGKATAGPWEAQYARNGSRRREIQAQFTGCFIAAIAPRQQVRSQYQGGSYPTDDQNFIAASRTLVPALADAAERLMEALELLSEGHGSVWCLSRGEEECRCGQSWPCPILARVAAIFAEEGE